MKMYEAILKRILKLCEENKISPNKLGTLSDLDPDTITSISYGKGKNTGIATVKTICDGLDITLFDSSRTIFLKRQI